MHLHRLALRSGASLLAALLIAVSLSASALGAPRPATGVAASIHAATSMATLKHKYVSSMTRIHQANGVRSRVNVARLAAHKPKVRPTAHLPFLTRQAKSTGAGKPRIVGPPPPVVASTNADDPVVSTGFDGLSETSGPLTNVDPPDPWVAVGPDHVVQAVNLSLQFTDRQGGASTTATLPDFFALPVSPVTFDSDPHVIYDSLHGRWVATEVSWDCSPIGGVSNFGNGYIDIAISDTADPTGGWSITGIYFPDQLPDYPAPGTSTDKLGFGSNVFDMTSSPGGDCLAGLSYAGGAIDYIDWADLINLGSLDILQLTLGSDTFTPRVALQVPATSATLQQFFIGDTGTSLDLVYLTIVGSVVAGTLSFDAIYDLTSDLIVTGFPAPPPPEPIQPGPTTITNALDERATDALWQGDRLVFVSTYPCGAGPRDCVRVTELDTTGANSLVEPTLTQDFLVAESGVDLFMGGIGLTGDGTLHVAWTRTSSSGTDYPSSYTAHQALGDSVNTISAPELVAAGTGVYTGSRWGDYVGVAQDPQVPNQAWDGNEYSGSGTLWKTKITQLQTDGTTYVPITPLRVLDTRFGTGLSGMFTSGAARSWQVGSVGTIPPNAVAVTGNLTVTGQGSAGYVSVTVTPTNNPPSSTINFPAGQTRANNVTIPLSSAGKLSAVFKGTSGKKTNLVFDVTGYFLADTSGGTFTPITPVRAIDTRFGTGLAGKFDANVPRTLIVAGGPTGVPGGATAITGNFTVVGPTKGGYASVTKDATSTPATSTINFPAGVNDANGVFAPLDGTGALSIVYKAPAGAKTDVLLDITGYFVSGLTGLKFVPLNPSRIMDTRPTAVLSGLTGKLTSGTPRTLDVDGHWGVPVGTPAVTGNLTVVGPQGSGYLSMTPDPDPLPATSSLNFPAGDTMANGIVGPLNVSGNSSFVYKSQAGKKTDLILDLSGYFE